MSVPKASLAESAAPKPEGLSDFAWKWMQAEDRRFTLRNHKLVAVMAAGMVTFFAVLDQFAYPEFALLFTALRWTCASIVLLLLATGRESLRKRCHRFYTIALPLIPAFFIAVTIFVARDPDSVYYAGLSLCIVGIGFLFQWTYKEAFAVSGIVLLLYLLACLPSILEGMGAKEAAGLFSNLAFLVVTGAVVVAGSYTHHVTRVEEFRVRDRLRQKKIAFRQKAVELRRILDELEETESQLIQSGKMASLGQLSAGVIHEIGNPLNHSNQALFLLRRRLRTYPEDEGIHDAVADIQDSIDRMKEIVRDLREFSAKRGEVVSQFPVREPVDAALRILGKAIDDHRVSVEIDIEDRLAVVGVKNQLAQVFVNLIHNATQAMVGAAGGAARSLATGEGGSRPEIRVAATEQDGRVVVRVRDNGPGIPAEARPRIFEPFFTTKDPGEGTGLGLSICFRILEAHRGGIQVASDGASYTEFELHLPVAGPLEGAASGEADGTIAFEPFPQASLAELHGNFPL